MVKQTQTTNTWLSMLNRNRREQQRLKEDEQRIIEALNNSVSMDKNGLMSCYAYQQLTPEEKSKICNGAGAAGQPISRFIPNSLYFLDCTEVFNIHDFDYYRGRREVDKKEADRRLLSNLMILINRAGGPLRWLRHRRALKYYEAVVELGHEAFYKGKQQCKK